MRFLNLLRVHHYIKNLLIYAAIFFGGQIGNLSLLLRVSLAFISFCFLSSGVYIINDIFDRKMDLNHPSKKNRPIACGSVSIKSAIIIASLLILLSFLINILMLNPLSFVLILLYFLSNLGYSIGLKNIPIVDIVILASGFLIRLFYGAMVADIILSKWLYLTVLVIAFFFGMGKRRCEMQSNNSAETRKVLKKYPLEFLNRNMYMFLTMALLFYAMWSVNDLTITIHGTDRLIYTVPMVIIIAMKYSLTIENQSDGDPIEVLFHDPWLILLCILYSLSVVFILYF